MKRGDQRQPSRRPPRTVSSGSRQVSTPDPWHLDFRVTGADANGVRLEFLALAAANALLAHRR